MSSSSGRETRSNSTKKVDFVAPKNPVKSKSKTKLQFKLRIGHLQLLFPVILFQKNNSSALSHFKAKQNSYLICAKHFMPEVNLCSFSHSIKKVKF